MNEPAPVPKAKENTIAAALHSVYMIHAACAAVLGIAVLLRYTVLRDVPEAGSVLYPVVTIIWGALGFTPPKPVMALAIAALETQQLKQLLSLRPAAEGNALSSVPPPPDPNVPDLPPLPPMPPIPRERR